VTPCSFIPAVFNGGSYLLLAFDLDGTLVDSAPDLAYCVDAMLERLGRKPAGEAQARAWIGNGVEMLIKRALTFELWPQETPEGFSEALACFMAFYADNLCERSRLYPGVREGLAALKAQGYKLACLTNKNSEFTLPLLEKLKIAQWFDYIGCGDQCEHRKPHPELLLKAAEALGVKPWQCILTGDSENDMEAGRAAGYACIAVPYGYRRCAHAEDLGADAVIESIADLPRLLAAQQSL
jgi:phosphoglycolate phosphatase